MLGIKKMNLLPLEYKNNELSRYMIAGIAAIAVVFVMLIVGMLINMGILNMSINSLKKQNTEYNATKVEITDLERQITENQSFINEHKQDFFDFYQFIKSLENYKPDGLTLVSVDSLDRMTVIEEEPKETMTPDTEGEQTDEIEAVEAPEPEILKTASYKKDLSGERLILRGLAKDTQDISTYIYKLSQSPMVSDIELSGIEEQMFNQKERITIFEAILEVR
jgi:Tfp pilus assembly protein PilN